ncbi:hypothetical protein cyc_01969 [Cyclospora cayetanensis]|uniref:Uncharacterized protein n=1 Tax=Cyclospora cayetanensis TaxID=88456 RepID=A0A1D3D331_9EIME|nr:hypothetical protein cyc_01969 [Cyclospora cayetanensis]
MSVCQYSRNMQRKRPPSSKKGLSIRVRTTCVEYPRIGLGCNAHPHNANREFYKQSPYIRESFFFAEQEEKLTTEDNVLSMAAKVVNETGLRTACDKAHKRSSVTHEGWRPHLHSTRAPF